jgi:hypothetical protein
LPMPSQHVDSGTVNGDMRLGTGLPGAHGTWPPPPPELPPLPRAKAPPGEFKGASPVAESLAAAPTVMLPAVMLSVLACTVLRETSKSE